MSTYKERLKQAQRPERTVQICLRGDLVAEWEAADRELKRAQENVTNSKEGAGTGELVDRIRRLEAEMLEHTEVYRLRALPKYKFRKLVADHPPRTGEDGKPVDEDGLLGVNRDTFFLVLIRASVVEPPLDDEDWDFLIGEDGLLTDRQIGDLEDAAWFLNRGEVNVPFSRAASRARPSSDSE